MENDDVVLERRGPLFNVIYEVLSIHRIRHLLFNFECKNSGETFLFVLRGAKPNKAALCVRLSSTPAGTMAFVREMGVSSHGHALICMLSSFKKKKKTGTPHCKRAG